MNSRVEKYSKNATTTSRTSRNKQLYDDLYSDTSYSNSVVIDESKEIDLNKIKEILEKERKYKEKKTYNPTNDIFSELESLTSVNDVNRIYDINEVLKSAKDSRDILEEANEKRKTQSKYSSHIDIQKELDRAKDAYDNLKHEETELLELMNTLTNATKEDLAMDMFSNLTDDAVEKQHTVDVRKVEQEKSQEYNSSTFMFDTKDFDDEMKVDDEVDDLKKSNVLSKVLIIIFVILFIAAAIFFIKQYILK